MALIWLLEDTIEQRYDKMFAYICTYGWCNGELALNCTFYPYFSPLPKTVLSYDFGWAEPPKESLL